MPSHAHVRVKKTKGKIPEEYITWSELGKPNIQAKGDVTKDKSQRRCLAQHCSVATLLRHGFDWLQHCLNIAMLCCANNRRWESSHVSLHETSRRPVRWSRTKAFLSSGNKTSFSCKFYKNMFIVLTTNMAAIKRQRNVQKSVMNLQNCFAC